MRSVQRSQSGHQFKNEIGAITSLGYDNIGRRTQITQADPDGAGPLASPVESLPTMLTRR